MLKYLIRVKATLDFEVEADCLEDALHGAQLEAEQCSESLDAKEWLLDGVSFGDDNN